MPATHQWTANNGNDSGNKTKVAQGLIDAMPLVSSQADNLSSAMLSVALV